MVWVFLGFQVRFEGDHVTPESSNHDDEEQKVAEFREAEDNLRTSLASIEKQVSDTQFIKLIS